MTACVDGMMLTRVTPKGRGNAAQFSAGLELKIMACGEGMICTKITPRGKGNAAKLSAGLEVKI